ncbi:molybdopterin-dependent oxidoreductase [Sulfolobus tengchongensis]|uniref:Molybdopterin-dependent oxidoreductase n=1 Tax=Sulfolobus tengchongensis TaxID=207809 RepID=A0AAX4KXF3_9CREN
MASNWSLKIYGLVEKQLNLSLDDIRKLPVVTITFDFRCVEGWVIENSEWQGVRVRDVLSLAKPLSNAKYSIFKSGDYTITLELNKALNDNVILAYAYKGELLTEKRGGPVRLVFPFQQCYESVKWLSEIEITDKYRESTGKRIALSRIGKGP